MPASKEQQWKPEEDNLLRSFVRQGLQLKQMVGLVPNRSRRAIECRAYILGLKSGQPRTKHSKDETFWSVPNILNSYYAGLAAADMSLGKERSTLAWACHIDDELYMETFAQNCGFTGKIVRINKKSPRSDNVSIHSTLRISACQFWNEDLAKNFNVIPNKVHRLQPPNIQSDLLKCSYLIGYTDGDGCIHASKKGTPLIRYASASQDIIEWIRSFVDSKFNFQVRPRKHRITSSAQNTYHSCNIYGMQAVKMFELLRTIDVPMFKRKWESPAFLTLVDQYKEKFPRFFAPDMELSFDETGSIVYGNKNASPSIPTISITAPPPQSIPP